MVRLYAESRPNTAIRNLSIHPEEKVTLEETLECVHRIPYKNCPKVYIGDTESSLNSYVK